jgi:putative hemolysin
MTLDILTLMVLLGLSGFFSGTETAFTSLSLDQIHGMKHRHGKRGALVESMLDRPDRLLTTVLIGNNLVNIAASAIASSITIQLYGSSALGAMTGLLTLFILIFGEVTPKQIAIVYNESIAVWTIPVIWFLSIVFRPVIWLVSSISVLVTRLTGASFRRLPTREGILHLVSHANTLGVIENFKYRMVRNVFRFNEVTVHAVMTHRTRVFSMSKDEKIRSALGKIASSGFSRVPVYDSDPERIVGIVLLKDLLRYMAEGKTGMALKHVMIPPIYVPETRKIHRMLTQFRKEGLNMAVVLDEYGGLAGIVTLEDVIEEILGEIYDENEERDREKITAIDDNTFLISADIPLYVLNDYLGLHLRTEGKAETLGGFLTEKTGHIPLQNEVVHVNGGFFSVESISRKRVLTVRFTRELDTGENGSRQHL